MNLKRKTIFFRLSRLAVLFVYISFFAVQCFFNYSSAQFNGENCAATFKTQIPKGTIFTVDSQKEAPGKQATIKLNKRFEPGGVSYFLTTYFDFPVYYFEPGVFSNYLSFFLTSSNLHTPALRGPPVSV